MVRRAGIAVCAVALAGALAVPAWGAFPGVNGRIVSANPFLGLYTSDEQGRLELLLVGGDTHWPAWSPDGTRVAFVSDGNTIQIADQAGNRTTVLEWGSSVGELDWSPAGDKLVANLFTCDADFECRMDVYTLNVDGSNLTDLTPEPFGDHNPAWSPAGDRIVFSSTRGDATDLYTVAPDGTGLTNLTSELPGSYYDADWSPDASHLVAVEQDPQQQLVTIDLADGARVPLGVGSHPAWSPDGTRIAHDSGVVTIRPDGTDRSVTRRFHGGEPDWQPLHIPATGSGYPRPKHATPFRVSLVVAYERCGTGDPPEFTHGPPFAYPSCHDRPSSETLTVDSRGKARGRFRMDAVRGVPGNATDEADVELQVDITGVSCRLTGQRCIQTESGLQDYTGELQGRVFVRITDRFNGAGTTDASATTMEAPLVFAIPCTPTADTTIGSTCSVTTSADAALPGSVPEKRRSIWEMSQVAIYDAGYDGQALSWPGWDDGWPFMRQGVFVR